MHSSKKWNIPVGYWTINTASKGLAATKASKVWFLYSHNCTLANGAFCLPCWIALWPSRIFHYCMWLWNCFIQNLFPIPLYKDGVFLDMNPDHLKWWLGCALWIKQKLTQSVFHFPLLGIWFQFYNWKMGCPLQVETREGWVDFIQRPLYAGFYCCSIWIL